jgi:adenylyltransferase/sulfurtransferase
MTSFRTERSALAFKSALVIGVGGLGCPAALALVRAGLGRVVLADDDEVELDNLHRQILFREEHVGAQKLDVAKATLLRRGGTDVGIELVRSRFLPENARQLARGVDVVLEGADNFATKFLAADACLLEKKPIVHGAAIRWSATVFAVPKSGAPCYRCLFEDLPAPGQQPSCDEAGVMGPVTGLAGALMADLALCIVTGDTPFGRIQTYDGKADRLRAVDVVRRETCALCGTRPTINEIVEARYSLPECAA